MDEGYDGRLHYCPEGAKENEDGISVCGVNLRQRLHTQSIAHVTCKECLESPRGKSARVKCGMAPASILTDGSIHEDDLRPTVMKTLSYNRSWNDGRLCVGVTDVTVSCLLENIAGITDLEEVAELCGLPEEAIHDALMDLSKLFDFDWALKKHGG